MGVRPAAAARALAGAEAVGRPHRAQRDRVEVPDRHRLEGCARAVRSVGHAALRVPINYPAWSSNMSVLVKGSAEAVSAVDLQVADVSWRADRLGYRAERSGVLQRSVRSMLVVKGLELAERV